jgi:hypothetical protein
LSLGEGADPQQFPPEPQQPPVFVIASQIAAQKPFFFPISFTVSFILHLPLERG